MRWFKHLFAGSARRLFPEGTLQRITDAIAVDEARHRGEICFAVESALDWRALWHGRAARERQTMTTATNCRTGRRCSTDPTD